MKKKELSPPDQILVRAAVEAAKKPISQLFGEKAPPLVAAALRFKGGEIITAVNLIADVGCLSVCAEQVLLAQAARHPGRKIEAIVAVYHEPGKNPRVVSPCGRCREAIADYALESSVILREPKKSTLFKTKAGDLLPFRYAEYWRGGKLV